MISVTLTKEQFKALKAGVSIVVQCDGGSVAVTVNPPSEKTTPVVCAPTAQE